MSDLFAQLAGGKALALRSLPAPDDEPEDEKTDQFQTALETARATDEEHQAALAGLADDEQSSTQAARLERRLRDKVRDGLGLPPWTGASPTGLADHARRLGIDPDFDLVPVPADRVQGARSGAAEFQALLLPDALERHLSKIRDTARTAAEETGVSTLHLAFGFLEWFESDSSDRKLTSPLLLMRVDIERTIVRSRYRYGLLGVGDEAQANLTLSERLDRDFRIKLPEFGEDDEPESYLDKVRNEICAGRKRWSVRHFVTLAHFPFARLAMFHDLDEALWAEAGGLQDHPLLGQLLGGAESGAAMFADEHDVDAPEVAAKVPLLVLEADASQHSAAYDVMVGRNLVIEGPPGTGKSQTITNIIAAALANGKRVLFMADKQAALQVVKDRLDNVGLGDFCLELHSGKARKKDVLDALEQRLARLPAGSGLDGLDPKLRELSTTRIALTQYVATLNAPFGGFGATVHDILWADRRRRDGEGAEARRLDAVALRSCETWTQSDIERRRSVLDRLERATQPILSGFGAPSDHPWFGITRNDLPSVDFEQVTWEAADTAAAMAQVGEVAGTLAALGIDKNTAILDLHSAAGTIARLSVASDINPDWYRGLSTEAARTAAEDWLRRCEDYQCAMGELRERGIACSGADAMEAAECLATCWAKLTDVAPPGLCVGGLSDWAADLSAEIERLRALARTAAQAASLIGITASGETDAALTALLAIELVLAADDRVIGFINGELAEGHNREMIAAASAEIAGLKARDETLNARFSLLPAASSDELRRHAITLREAGVFGFLSPATRAATRCYARLRRVPGKATRQQMSLALASVAEHLDALAALDIRHEYRAVFGSRFRGLATDTAAALAVADWAAHVRSELAGMDETDLSARRTLLSGDQERLQALLAFAVSGDFAALSEFICGQPSPPASFSSLIGGIKATIAAAAALADACVQYGVPGSTRAADLPSTCRLLQAAHAADTAARIPEPLASELRDRAPRPLDDLGPFRAALALAEAVGDLAIGDEGRRTLHAMSPADIRSTVLPAAEAVCAALDRAVAGWRTLQARLRLDETSFLGGPMCRTSTATVAERLHYAASHSGDLGGWIAYLIERAAADALGLGELLVVWDERAVSGRISGAFDRVLYHGLARLAFARHPELDRFTGLGQDEARARFKTLDVQATELRRRMLANDLTRRPVPGGNGIGKRGDYTDQALILLEIGKQKRHIPIRQLLDRAGAAVQALKPCFMMSPLSVAQYLKPDGPRFDLLVIDEASQMRPEDALGAIARSDQIVVVGDPKQLPPTSFFARLDNGSDDDETEDEQVDAESILDLAQAVFRPMRRLRWHYRSRHGSLIAFSNRAFYEDDLIVFPSPAEANPTQGVASVKVDGIYKARSNLAEVASVCAAAVEHMRRCPERSLGIATMNQVQRERIAQEMDRLAAANPEVEAYRRRWSETLERFFVKNLENVQGDERDVIFISTVFGPSAPGGRVRQVFGPINGASGHRRLNVLFTRAKHHVRLFTSMTPDDVLADADSPRGAQVLKAYLAYAADGRLDAGQETGREADSDFEVFVRDRLRLAGYDAVSQVGVAGFSIDLAVRHPDAPGLFLLGVECDGASYHSSRSARDRDILRQQVLEGLGWAIYRIWSTDWFRDPAGQTRKLTAHLEELRRRPLLSVA